MKEEYCPQCPNHCERKNLRCPRGRAYFGEEGVNDNGGNFNHQHGAHGRGEKPFELMTEQERVLSSLRKCGHFLHHGANMEESKMFSALSETELATLSKLLKKLYDSWNR